MAYKQSPFPLIEGTSPVKGIVSKIIKKGTKVLQKYFTKTNPISSATKPTQHFVKYDPSSKHLRFKTNLSSKGGTTTSSFVATKGTPGTKNFGFDFSRKMNVTPQQSKDLDKIMKIYKPK